MANSAPTTQHYSGKDIRVLEGLEPVRKRPGMYIGSTDTRGLHHCVKEIVDNSVDEGIVGYAKEISLYMKQDGYITVTDDGRGIPVDMHPSGVSALEIAMTKLHAGGKFDEMAYQASGGLHGVGASAVNALSTHMQVVVKRDKKYWYQEYHIGVPVAKVAEISEEKVLKLFPWEGPSFIRYATGTLSNFQPDASIFQTVKYSFAVLRDFLRERAYLMAGLYFRLFDEVQQAQYDFYFEGGIRSMVKHLNHHKVQLHPVIHMDGVYQAEKFKIAAEIAMQYTDAYSETIEMFANTIKTPDGGTHLTGFRTALNKSLKDYATRMGLIKNEKDSFTSEDLREGLTAVIFVKMPSDDLQFESQTKAKLNNTEAQSAVYQIVKDKLDAYLEEHPKDAQAILDKVMLAARARLAARAAKDAVIRKGALEGLSLPGKLADCQSRNPEESEIYIVEGDSAGGCFAGDTKVALADGRHLSFLELEKEQQQGKQNFCYTIRRNGKIGLEKIENVRRTKKNAAVIQVHLDNGEVITCTPDHRFLLRNGEYKEAAQLTSNDSLMPLYRQLSSMKQPGITIEGYEMVWDPSSDSWLFTHQLADWYNRWQGIYRNQKNIHCHHVDFNKLNNNPTNITQLSATNHLELHRQHVEKTLHRPDVLAKCKRIHQSVDYKRKISQLMSQPTMKTMLSLRAKAQWQSAEYKRFMTDSWHNFCATNQQYREENVKRLNQQQNEYWAKSANRQKQSQKVQQYFATHADAKALLSMEAQAEWNNPQLVAWRQQKTKEQWTPDFRLKRLATLQKTYYKKTIAALKQIEHELGRLDLAAYQQHRLETKDRSLLRFDSFCQRYFGGNQELATQAVSLYNHRIVKIVASQTPVDVYDLEVPGTHNFALASGIFVHNSAKQGRDRRFQAIFPLRGKILNTERARLDKIIDFEELKNLVVALGTGIGDTFDPSKLRYHRIILMNDADVDGEHITTLALTFFFRHLPDVVTQGYLYIAMPPLFKVWNKKQIAYAFNEEEREQKVAELKKNNPTLTLSVQRYKGLGEMNPEQLWETTMQPSTRVLKQVTIEDVNKADQIFDILMGSAVPPRKKFIQTNAKLATLDV